MRGGFGCRQNTRATLFRQDEEEEHNEGETLFEEEFFNLHSISDCGRTNKLGRRTERLGA